MTLGARTEGYAASGHQSTTDGSVVTLCTAEIPDHHHAIAEVTYMCRQDDDADYLYHVSRHAVYRNGAGATYIGNLQGSSSADNYDLRASGHCTDPTVDCTGTTLRVRGTGIAAHNLEHFAFVQWLALGQYLA